MVVYIKFYSFYELKNNGSENTSNKIDHLNKMVFWLVGYVQCCSVEY